MCRRKDSLLGGAALLAGAEVVQPGLADRADPVARSRRARSISASASSSRPASASAGASLGCSATPATSASWVVAASTAQRAPGRSQPICTIRVTPTAAACAIASPVGSQEPSGPSAMSRWQWLSTTGCGSGSGGGRAVAARRRRGSRAGRCTRPAWVAPRRTRPAWAGRRARATSRIASLRVAPACSSSATSAASDAGSDGTSTASTCPSTTIVTSPRTPSAAQAASVGQPGPSYLLVGLGQLPAHGAATVRAERLGHRGQRRRGAVRRLEEHHRALLVAQRGQPPAALARLAGQEALEAEPVDRQPGHGQRGEHRGRAGDGGDRDAALDRGGHQPVAGVGHRRHPGVGDQQHPLAGLERLDERRGAGRPRCPRSRTPPGR